MQRGRYPSYHIEFATFCHFVYLILLMSTHYQSGTAYKLHCHFAYDIQMHYYLVVGRKLIVIQR